MAARIRSLRNGITPVDEASRDDIIIGDIVVVSSIDAATTYDWTLVYVPKGSLAVFSGTSTSVSPGSFTIDKVGPYLVRLVTDSGLPSEDTQYVRIRALTTSLGLTLVSAGERRDGTGIIPVDVDATGWADEQNSNLLALETAIVASAGTLGTLSYNKNIPEVPNDSVSYRGWVSVACELIGVRVRMMTVNTQGAYTLEVTNEVTGNTVLTGPTFDMNTLVAGVVQPVPLTAVTSDLNFSALDSWKITLTSDNPLFDGSDIYVELLYNTATAGGPVVEDWATTLLVGNISGGTHVILTNGDEIRGQAAPAASGLDGFDLVLRGGAGDGLGGQGAVVVDGKLTVTGVIDPIGIIFSQDSGLEVSSTAGGEGSIFISSGAGGLQRDTPYFVPESAGGFIPMLGGEVLSPTINTVTVPTQVGRSVRLFSPIINTGGTSNAKLPPADEMRGVLIAVEHRGDGTGTLSLDGTGTDTINGSALPLSALLGETILLLSDGVSDWRLIQTGGGTGGASFIHKNVPPTPNGTVRYDGWVSRDSIVSDISVAMGTVNTQGNYTATFTNLTTGNTMLMGANFDMNGLAAGTVTPLTLTGTPTDLTFSAGDQWAVEITSDNLLFDGSGTYWSILFGSAGSLVVPTAPDDDHQFESAILPNNTVNTLFFPPYDCTIVGVKAYAQISPVTSGVYTLEVEDIDGGNNLLSAPTFDMTSLAAATLTSIPLTVIGADLDISAGTRVRFRVTSDNADLVASGIYLQIIYRSQ